MVAKENPDRKKGKSHFEDDGAQNYSVFQPKYRYFKKISGVGNGKYIYFWKSKGLSDERINFITASNYSITPELSYYGTKIRIKLTVMNLCFIFTVFL